MGSLLRSVKKCKKSHRFGEVEIVRYEEYRAVPSIYSSARTELD